MEKPHRTSNGTLMTSWKCHHNSSSEVIQPHDIRRQMGQGIPLQFHNINTNTVLLISLGPAYGQTFYRVPFLYHHDCQSLLGLS